MKENAGGGRGYGIRAGCGVGEKNTISISSCTSGVANENHAEWNYGIYYELLIIMHLQVVYQS